MAKTLLWKIPEFNWNYAVLITIPASNKKETKIQPCWLGFVPIHVTNSTAQYQGKDETKTLYDADTDADTDYNAHVVLQRVNQFTDATLKHAFKHDTQNIFWPRVKFS
jgi:hypothetical protein